MNRLAAIIVTIALFPAITSAAQEAASRVHVVSGNVYVTQGKNPAHRVTTSESIASDTQAPKPTRPEDSLQKSFGRTNTTGQNKMGTDSKSGVGLTAKIGTLGYGAELNFGISASVSSRIGFNAHTLEHNAHSGLVNYDFKLQLQTAGAVVDWYPFADSFRTSVGMFYDNNKLSFVANDTNGGYIINGRAYSTGQVGSLHGTMSCNKAAPYIGIGWGNPVAKNKDWDMVVDMGVLFQRNLKLDLTATCTDPLVCNQLRTDAAAESARMKKELDFFQWWWPVVSIGISYQW